MALISEILPLWARIRSGVTGAWGRAEIRMMPGEDGDDQLLTPSEVAEMFRVNPKTVTRWARTGRSAAIAAIDCRRFAKRSRPRTNPTDRRND
jgi:hypothetical protein